MVVAIVAVAVVGIAAEEGGDVEGEQDGEGVARRCSAVVPPSGFSALSTLPMQCCCPYECRRNSQLSSFADCVRLLSWHGVSAVVTVVAVVPA